MGTRKPQSIKTIGVLVIVLGSLIMFSNAVGALAFSMMFMGEVENSGHQGGFDSYYLIICFTMFAVGVAYLISGIFIRHHKLWANKLAVKLSLVVIALMLVFTLFGVTKVLEVSSFVWVKVLIIIAGTLAWCSPFGLLVWFLRKEDIRKHFV